MAEHEREETKALISLELWQLVLIVVVFLALVGRFVVGAGLPTLNTHMLLVVLLLVVLGGLLVMRRRKQNAG